MAKGVEDTAFYRYNRLVALNEVGGDLTRFGVTPDEFHRHNLRIAAEWPATMTTTSTHDTKRSEDVRARLALLSEIPDRWAEAVARWSAGNRRHHRHGWPDPDTEYVLYQTLVGAHPLPPARLEAYLLKAGREAKVHTSWTDPDPAFEAAVAGFAEALLADEAFVADLDRFVAPLIWPGRVNALAQTALKLLSPGVPDTYQGTELWDDSLVDPDNRRPVDFELRRRLLAEVDQRTPEQLLERAEGGLPKLAVIRRGLAVRRRLPHCFRAGPAGAYRPLAARGAAARHLVGFGRGDDVVVLAPRLVLGLAACGGWRETVVELPEGHWTDELTGDVWPAGGAAARAVSVADLLGRFPVAILTHSSGERAARGA
jgi:(1->4)-alpha-D-glucan 1-alpha-D-glucosylmutase